MALLAVSEALSRMLASAVPMPGEPVGLREARGRTLSEPVVAHIDNPPFDASAMDGYAVRAADVASPGTRLQLIGASSAGRPFSGKIEGGQTVRIFTGAQVPQGADAIVIQEDTQANDDGSVAVSEVPSAAQHIRKRGEDFAAGEPLIDRGVRLKSREILLAATAGYASLEVVRKPVVAILSTGDELVEPGQPLADGQIFGSNAYALAALIEGAGGEARIIPSAKDTLEALGEALATAGQADILLTVGGASVGDHDLVRPALEKAGARLDFYKVAMRPGKPLFFGVRESNGKRQLCLGLPGNPVSALICARVFLVPLMARMLGREAPIEPFDAVAAAPIPANGPREHYMRGSLDLSAMPPRVAPLASQDSGRVSLLQKAECLIVVPSDTPAQKAGSAVKVLPFDF